MLCWAVHRLSPSSLELVEGSFAGGEMVAGEDALVPLGEWGTSDFVCNAIAALPELPAVRVRIVAVTRGTLEVRSRGWLGGGFSGGGRGGGSS